MKNSVKALMLMATLALVPTMAKADTVAMTFHAETLFSRPSVVLPANSTIVVLVDKDGDNSFGFENTALTSSTWLPDSGDSVIARFASLSGGVADQSLNFEISATNSASVIGPGDKLLMLWYETPYNAAATGPGEGVNYGMFRTDSFLDGEFNFTIPSGGASGNLLAFSVSNGGSTPDADLVGNLQTPIVATPEPASLAVLAVGGLALMARRRRA
jgi:hypothetical protein